MAQTTVTQSGVTTVSVADVGGTVVASTNPTLVGTTMPLGDAGVRAGRGWSGAMDIAGSRERVA